MDIAKVECLNPFAREYPKDGEVIKGTVREILELRKVALEVAWKMNNSEATPQKILEDAEQIFQFLVKGT